MIKEFNDYPLKNLNTFGIEARCSTLVEFDDPSDLPEIWERGVFEKNWNVLGGGSNVVFTADFQGTIIHCVDKRIGITSHNGNYVNVKAAAGVVWDNFVSFCVGNDLWGAENLSGIPGSVGASPVQNVGAYGAEAADIIASVELFSTETGKFLTLAADHCSFSYRSSIFKTALQGRVIVTAVNYRLSLEKSPRLEYGDLSGEVERLGGADLHNIRQAVIAIRNRKLPDPAVTGNAGSFFRNPVVASEIFEKITYDYESVPGYPAGGGRMKLAAAWLIEQAGWKGRRIGNVGVSEKQALVLVNYGAGTGDEILRLAGAIIEDVRRKFGVELEKEVVVI